MSWLNLDKARRRLVLSLSVLSLALVCLWFGADLNSSTAKVGKSDSNKFAPAATFPGTGVGTIPDAGCGVTDREVSFAVTGISGPPSNVEVNMTFNPAHTFAGDVDMELVSPNGIRHWIQSYTGGQGGDFGDGSDLAGPYVFKDSAPSAPTWWTAAFLALSTDPIPAGSYRTQAPGPFANDDPGPPITNMTAAFAGIPTSNGTWKLVIGDCAGGDTGSISVANLTIDAAAASAVALDHDGDGKTDHMVARATNNPLSENAVESPFNRAGSYRERLQLEKESPIENLGGLTDIYWYTLNSGNALTGAEKWGIASTDFITPNDFDGDLKSDIAVWRTGAAGTAAFYILKTTDITVQTEVFGQTNDDSGVTGDYDGDGKADVAVFRCPAAAGPCFFYYRGSNANPTGNITYQQWGNGTLTTLFANPGDFDGDGKHDFNLQRTNPNQPGKGQFVLLRSSDFGVEFINWGNNTDIIAPGDYDGDGKDDFTVIRNNSGTFRWYTLYRTGGTDEANWGVTNDFLTPGDYDGDGKTDRSVWRPSNGTFYSLRSTNFSLLAQKWGQNGDYPPANGQVH